MMGRSRWIPWAGVWGRGGVAPHGVTSAAAGPTLSSLLSAVPQWVKAWTGCCGTHG